MFRAAAPTEISTLFLQGANARDEGRGRLVGLMRPSGRWRFRDAQACSWQTRKWWCTGFRCTDCFTTGTACHALRGSGRCVRCDSHLIWERNAVIVRDGDVGNSRYPVYKAQSVIRIQETRRELEHYVTTLDS